MPKFKITLQEIVHYTVEVEAADADEASKEATELWNDSSAPTTDFDGYGFGVEVEEIEEITEKEPA